MEGPTAPACYSPPACCLSDPAVGDTFREHERRPALTARTVYGCGFVVLACLHAGCHLVYSYSERDASEPGDLEHGERALLDSRGDHAVCPSLIPQILPLAAAQDDGEIEVAGTYRSWMEQGETPDAASGDPPGLYMGNWDTGLTWAYFRFPLSAPIPAGASVVEATLELWGKHATAGWSTNNHALRVHGELSADAPVVSSSDDLPDVGSRAFTQQSVRWPPSGGLTWYLGAYNVSPNLSAIVQEVLTAQGGLAAGSYLQLWLSGDFSTGAAEVATPEFRESQPQDHSPRLTLRHCAH
jgi:hypothetical protein